ncbi:DUF3575 domain-containing protein [Polaribacter glomeratus]|uniref:DUF3575 domain-containing protein n=1 Tax=Polaribacter glomeratus TaxID=102 RepID=A0A2S7WFG4_9FLAO|nr:DUF3575 domain-containing protein [Polaribacter glomeratus]PQJ76363.1 hypothetical protein BTO16_10635 [Polaribacter glomeratus]TXD65498.1 DUF3575 domain-containing protein [Polaribacter glomeratus]
MKKIALLLFLFTTTISFAQERAEQYPQDINKKHELKLNAFSLIVFSSLDVSYEYLLNKDSSFGVSVFYNFNDINNELYYPKKFSLTPYYRWFFTEKTLARGFFVEGFGMLNTYEDINYGYYDNNGNYINNNKAISETDFALGVSVGGKFTIKSGFTAEVYAGVGRNLFNNNDNNNNNFENNIITRGGISLGYRF